MRRILFFADATSVHTQRWVYECAARGFDCVVVTRRPGDVPAATDVIAVRPGGDSAGWWLALPEVRRLARHLAPAWVHGHYVTSYGLWAAASGVPPRVPVVLTAWGSDILVTPRENTWRGVAMRGLVGWSLRRATLITADSRDVLNEIGGYGVAGRREEVFWGADTERFQPGSPARGFEVASLRNWEPNYNIDTLLRAWALCLAVQPVAEPVLHLLGGGPDHADLRVLARDLGVATSVRFTGRVDDAAMVHTLQRSRVSVTIPSSDATSVSMLESMACGLPVIASDLPANRQWIDAADGLIVPPRDEHALARALSKVHGDPVAAAAVGARNRSRVAGLAARRGQFDRMALLYESVRAAALA